MKSAKEKDRIFADKGAFRRRVSLASVQLEGLGESEIAMALAYEVEPYSAIPAAEAEVAWSDVESDNASVRVFEVAVVRRRKGGASGGASEKWVKPLAAVGALILLATAGEALYMRHRCAVLEKSLGEREVLQRELDRLSKRASEARARAEELRVRRETAVKARERCTKERGAYLDFLEGVASVGGRTVLKSIAAGTESFSLELLLASADAQSAAESLDALTVSLAQRGWKVEPGDIGASAGGGLVEIKAKARFAR